MIPDAMCLYWYWVRCVGCGGWLGWHAMTVKANGKRNHSPVPPVPLNIIGHRSPDPSQVKPIRIYTSAHNGQPQPRARPVLICVSF